MTMLKLFVSTYLKGAMFAQCLFLSLLFLSMTAQAAEKITVTVGQGRLVLQMADLPLDEQSKKEIETTLLINKKLQSVIDSSETRTIVLEGEAVDKIHKNLQTAKNQTQRHIQSLIENQFLRNSEAPKDGEEQQAAVLRTGETQVIAGSKYHVQNGEYLEQLVSLGSEVTVEGEVSDLVAIGGKVILRSGARISKELVIVGAELQQEEGAEIANLTSGLQWHGIDHNFFGFRDYYQGFWPYTFLQMFRVSILCLFGWLWFKAAPAFHQDIQLQLKKKPIASLFWTVFAILLLIPTTILLVVSIVGIVILPVLFLMYVAFWFMAEVHWAKFIADRLPFLKAQDLFVQLLFGLIIFEVLDRVLPSVLGWVTYLLLVIGFGAIFSQFLRRGIAWRN